MDIPSLQRLGWNILPIKPGSKLPNLYKWEQYQKEKYRGRLPEEGNFGAILGNLTGYLVIDTDSLRATEWAIANLPQTGIRCQTRKGIHFYYKMPEFPVRCGKPKFHIDGEEIRHEMDLKAEGGYVLIPPSKIDGNPRSYEWISFKPSEVPVFDPKWIDISQSTTISNFSDVKPLGIEKIDTVLQALISKKQITHNQGNRYNIYVKDTVTILEDLKIPIMYENAGPMKSQNSHINGYLIVSQQGLFFASNAGGVFARIPLSLSDQYEMLERMK